MIPQRLVDQLGLVLLDEVTVSGFGGQVFFLPTYGLEVSIRGCRSELIEVLAHEDEPLVLLGRDVLNSHRIILDGPQLALVIE